MRKIKKRKGKGRKRGFKAKPGGQTIFTQLQDPVLISIDVETTGLGIFTRDELIEIGAVAGEGRNFRRHFIPSVPIARSASRVHGMIVREEEGGEKRLCVEKTGEVLTTVPLEEGLRDLVQFLEDYAQGRPVLLIAHNAGFDGRFIRGALEETGVIHSESFEKIFLGCSLVASRRLDPHIKGPGKHKQEAVYRRIFNKTYGEAHTGLGDATALFEIIAHWKESHGSEKLQENLNIIETRHKMSHSFRCSLIPKNRAIIFLTCVFPRLRCCG